MGMSRWARVPLRKVTLGKNETLRSLGDEKERERMREQDDTMTCEKARGFGTEELTGGTNSGQ